MLKESFGFITQSASLESLYLVETDVSDDLIDVSFLKREASGLENLRDIDLSHNSISSSYLTVMKRLQQKCHLINNISIASCKFFQAQNQPIDAIVMTYIDPSFPSTPSFLYLRRLDLSSSIKGDEAAANIADSSAFKYLEFLKLKNCGIGNQGFADLVASTNLRRLRVLILSKNSISKLTFPFDDLKAATVT